MAQEHLVYRFAVGALANLADANGTFNFFPVFFFFFFFGSMMRALTLKGKKKNGTCLTTQMSYALSCTPMAHCH
jgi:hypothetical protein